MEKRVLGIAAVTALLAVSAIPVPAQEAVAPEYKWVKGDALRYRLAVEKVSKVTGAQQMEMTQSWTYALRHEVKDVAPDGTATIEAKLESAGVRIQIPAKKMDFTFDPGNPDDAKRAGSPLAIPFVALPGEAITYKVSKKGKILEVAGFKELTQKIVDKVKAAPQGAGYVALAVGALDDMQTSLMETAFHRMPEKQVKLGGDYRPPKTRQADPALGPLLLETTCTLVGVEAVGTDDSYRFKCDTIEKVEPPAPGATPPPPAPSKLTDARSNTEFFLSKAKGIVLKSGNTSTLVVETAVPAQPNAPPSSVTQADEIRATLDVAPADAPPAAVSAPPAPPAEGTTR